MDQQQYQPGSVPPTEKHAYVPQGMAYGQQQNQPGSVPPTEKYAHAPPGMAYEQHSHTTGAPGMPYEQHSHTGGPAVASAQHSHAGAHGKWAFGLCDCCSPFSTCCLGTWCPCFLYGKTYARNHGDPDSDGCNSSCLAWYALSCIGGTCILQCLNRGSVREKNGIEGGACGDFCISCCCACCALIQEDKESIVRTTGMNPKTKQPYASPGQMAYP